MNQLLAVQRKSPVLKNAPEGQMPKPEFTRTKIRLFSLDHTFLPRLFWYF